MWNGLELKLRRWQDRVADEYEQIGKEAFAARIGEDYADYINSLTDPEAAPQQAAPEPETAKPAGVQAWSARELSEMVLPPIRHVVEGLLPMGLFGRSPPVCRERYTSGSPPHFSRRRNQRPFLRRSRSPCRERLQHPG